MSAAPVMPLSAPVPADMLDNWDPTMTLDDPVFGTRPVTLEGQIVPSIPAQAPPPPPPSEPLAAPVPLAFTAFAPPAQPLAVPEEDPLAQPPEATEAMLEQMKATTRRINTLAEALHSYLDASRERSS